MIRFFRRKRKNQEESKPELRPAQKKALQFILQSRSRIVGLEAPTGFGKTFVMLNAAKQYIAKGKKVVISTYTKQLQDQYLEEIKARFPELLPETVLIKGKSNFVCIDKLQTESDLKQLYEKNEYLPNALRIKVSVDEYCSEDYIKICPFREQCEYMKMLEKAAESSLLIVNHFILPLCDGADVVIIDEAHLVDQALIRTETRDFSFLKGYVPDEAIKKCDLEIMFDALLYKAEEVAKQTKDIREVNKINALVLKLRKIARAIEESPSVKVQDGTIEYTSQTYLNFEEAKKVIYTSGTFPEVFHAVPEPEDFIRIVSKTYTGVKIEIEPVDYREEDYYEKVEKAIKELLQKHDRVMILATSKAQLKELKEIMPEIVTTLDEPPFKLVENFKRHKYKVIAGTDVLWTGVDVPGEKGILIMKLPFEHPDRVKMLPNAETIMAERALVKFKQGIGRMKRTDKCRGTIKIMDWRVTDSKYDFMKILEEYEKLGAEIENKVGDYKYQKQPEAIKPENLNGMKIKGDLEGLPPELMKLLG